MVEKIIFFKCTSHIRRLKTKNYLILSFYIIPSTRYLERVCLKELWRDLIIVVVIIIIFCTHGTHVWKYLYPWCTFSKFLYLRCTFPICWPPACLLPFTTNAKAVTMVVACATCRNGPTLAHCCPTILRQFHVSALFLLTGALLSPHLF